MLGWRIDEKLGSSPHTRGAPALSPVHACEAGIIPAYAGSTVRCSEVEHSDGDHPRIRGEHFMTASRKPSFVGSSPHTRGAQLPI